METSIEKKKIETKNRPNTHTTRLMWWRGGRYTHFFFNELPNDEIETHSILPIQAERIPQLFVLVFLTQYSSHTVYIVLSFDGLYIILIW